MKIFKKNYIGINYRRNDITIAPLAFLTPYEDTAAGKKRQETVRDWAGEYFSWGDYENDRDPEFKIVDNKPQTGFKVVGYSERGFTSNKVIRVYDPSGFELEISVPNLVDLMMTGTIENGEIMGELIWGREGANNRLIRTDSELYKNCLKEGQTMKATPGDRVIGNHGREYIYLGKGFYQAVAVSGIEIKNETGPGNILCASGATTLPMNEKAEHVYIWVQDEKRQYIISRKSEMKITANMGPSGIEWNDNTIGRFEGRLRHDANGKFQRETNLPWFENASQFPYDTSAAMFRTEKFTSDDLDFETIKDDLTKVLFG